MTDFISIIMSVYNETEEQLQEAIESILMQTYTNFEFIIVLDNPEKKRLLLILEAYRKKDKRIKLIINNKNRGLVYSLNRALRHSKGGYIARMDADDISLHNRLEEQLQFIKSHNLDLIGSAIYDIDEKGFKIRPVYFASKNYIKFMLFFAVMQVCHPTFFVKREVYIKLAGYNDVLYAEDVDFLARALCAGYKIGNINKVLLYYRRRRNSITNENTLLANSMGKNVASAYRKCLITGKYRFYKMNSFLNSISKKKVITYKISKSYHKKAIKYKNKGNYLYYIKYIICSVKFSNYMLDYLRLRIMGIIVNLTSVKKDSF